MYTDIFIYLYIYITGLRALTFLTTSHLLPKLPIPCKRALHFSKRALYFQERALEHFNFNRLMMARRKNQKKNQNHTIVTKDKEADAQNHKKRPIFINEQNDPHQNKENEPHKTEGS